MITLTTAGNWYFSWQQKYPTLPGPFAFSLTLPWPSLNSLIYPGFQIFQNVVTAFLPLLIYYTPFSTSIHALKELLFEYVVWLPTFAPWNKETL